PEVLLYSLVAWLALLGLLRRLVLDAFTVSGNDPLLVVGPLALGILAAVAIQRGANRNPTTLTKAIFVLAGLMVLGALNPRQGSLSAGVTSLLYTLVPLLAFWIGRGLCADRVFARVLWVITGFAVVTALYGLAQTFVGFPSWDKSWALQQTTYNAL